MNNAENDNRGVISDADSTRGESKEEEEEESIPDAAQQPSSQPQQPFVPVQAPVPPQHGPPPLHHPHPPPPQQQVPPLQPQHPPFPAMHPPAGNFAHPSYVPPLAFNHQVAPPPYMMSPPQHSQQFFLPHHHHHPPNYPPPPPQAPHLAPPPPQPTNTSTQPDPASSIQYYEARMRDHAAAYASAAAGAAWAAAQMAAAAADFASGNGPPPQMLSPGLFGSSAWNHNNQADDHDDRRRKRGVPRRSDQRGRIRRRGGEDSSSTSSCSTTFVKKSARKKKARSDDSLLGKTAVAALYEWCSRRKHLPSFVLQQVSPTHFDCVVSLEDDVEWGRGQGRNKGAAKQAAAKQALQSLCPTAVFDETSGFVIGLTNSVEDLAPHLEKQLAIYAADDNVSSTTEFSEDENEYYKTAQGASILSNLLFTTIQIDSRIDDTSPKFTYQIVPAVQAQPLKRKTTTSDASRGRFTCTAELRVRWKPGGEKEVLQTKGVGTSKREARHMSCARLLVKLFPECKGDLVQVKKAAEAARARHKSTRTMSKEPPIPEVVQLGLQEIMLNAPLRSPTSTMRKLSRRKQLDTRVEKALHNFHELDGKRSSSDHGSVGRTILRRAEPEDLGTIKRFMRLPNCVGNNSNSAPTEAADVVDLTNLWSPSCIVLLLCRDASYEDPPLGCAIVNMGFQFQHGKILRVVRLATESHVPQERFLDCLKSFARCMDSKLIPLEPPTTMTTSDQARQWMQLQLKSCGKGGVASLSNNTNNSSTATLQSVQEGEEEGSDQPDGLPANKPSNNRSKRSRVE